MIELPRDELFQVGHHPDIILPLHMPTRFTFRYLETTMLDDLGPDAF